MHNTRDCCKYDKDRKEKANFRTTKNGRKKSSPARQNFVPLNKKLDKLEKALKKLSLKSKKRHYKDSDSDSKKGAGSGSTRKVEINLGNTIKKTKFTPPSPMNATPTLIASNPDDVCPASFSNASDVMMMSPSQNKGIHANYSTPPNKDPPEGKPRPY